jgi:hypothetical protein
MSNLAAGSTDGLDLDAVFKNLEIKRTRVTTKAFSATEFKLVFRGEELESWTAHGGLEQVWRDSLESSVARRMFKAGARSVLRDLGKMSLWQLLKVWRIWRKR